MIKKIDLLIIKAFIRPFILTFFIVVFLLLMLFLFKYIDDLVGKGFAWYVILELLFYASSSQVSLALPLAVLLSSIMTLGNLGENYELVALKSAGISLRRVMMPLIIIAFLLSGAAFLFSNYVMPKANLKMGALLYDVRQQKPSFLIKEGIFYDGIDGYSIKIGRKDADEETIYDVIIYDHTNDRGNDNVLLASRGRMIKSTDERYLIFKLYNGVRYEESRGKSGNDMRRQFVRFRFKEQEVRFDLSGFQLNRTDEALFKNNYQMLNVKQLKVAGDSLEKKVEEKKNNYTKYVYPYFQIFTRPGVFKSIKAGKDTFANNNFLKNFPESSRAEILRRADNSMRNILSHVESASQELKVTEKLIWRHNIEYHRKYTLSIACIILFFIGAPLGAIIRKGGLGMPVIVSIVFFLIFHILSIVGEKFSKDGALPAYEGMWIATAVLAPLGIYLTRKATSDSGLFDMENYTRFFTKIFGKKKDKAASD